MATEQIIPGDMIANDYPVATRTVTLVSGQNLARGAVLGKITTGGKYTLSLSASDNGSEAPRYVLAAGCDASGGDATAVVYASGAFDASKLIFGTGITSAALEAAWEATQAPLFIKNPV